jgi:cysteine desulfurase
MQHIYLDYNASTPIDPAVAVAMGPFLDGHFGNPSSGHWASIGAKAALETARDQVGKLLGILPVVPKIGSRVNLELQRRMPV